MRKFELIVPWLSWLNWAGTGNAAVNSTCRLDPRWRRYQVFGLKRTSPTILARASFTSGTSESESVDATKPGGGLKGAPTTRRDGSQESAAQPQPPSTNSPASTPFESVDFNYDNAHPSGSHISLHLRSALSSKYATPHGNHRRLW